MHQFEELKEQLTAAFCRKCERSDRLLFSTAIPWCGWCSQECEVSFKSVDVISKQTFESLHVTSNGKLVNLKNVPLQPLRIPCGWKVAFRNHLFEIDPTPETVSSFYLFNQTMLVLSHEKKQRLMDVGWTDELNFEDGQYYIDLYEGDYKGAVLRSLRTKDRIELVNKIEAILEEISNGS